MSPERWLLCVTATLVTDATWLFLLLAFLGFTAGIDGAPLPWPVIFGLPMLAALTHLLARRPKDPASNAPLVEPFLGIVVIYWAVSVGRIDNGAAAGFGWPLAFLTGALEPRAVYSTVIVLLSAAYLWSRGIRRANEPAPGAALLRSFRAGLVVFAGIICFEAMGDLDLGSQAMMLPFFAASLLGLAVAHSVGRLDAGTGWLGFAAASVAAILATGLLAAILGSLVIRQSADVLSAGWIAMMTTFVAKVSAFLTGLELEGSGGRGDQGAGSGAPIVDPPGAAGPEWSTVEVIVSVVEPLVLVAGTALFIWVCRKLLAAPERRWPKALIELAFVERESLGEQEALGISELFQRVLPGWMRRPVAGRRVPALGPGIEEVYALYFRLLEAARGRGAELFASQTPFERAPRLNAVLAGAPVEEITRRFVAACYGREPTGPADIASLDGRLEEALRNHGARGGR